MWAAHNGNAEVVEQLLAGGADVRLANDKGWTALTAAASNGKLEAVQQLLAAGATAAVTDAWGRSVADLAKQNQHGEVVALLEAAVAEAADAVAAARPKIGGLLGAGKAAATPEQAAAAAQTTEMQQRLAAARGVVPPKERYNVILDRWWKRWGVATAAQRAAKGKGAAPAQTQKEAAEEESLNEARAAEMAPKVAAARGEVPPKAPGAGAGGEAGPPVLEAGSMASASLDELLMGLAALERQIMATKAKKAGSASS